jgi:hypothetical protein
VPGLRGNALGHEVIIFGYVEGADAEGLRSHNAGALTGLPAEDEWPFLVRGMFALPAEWPQGTYRAQVIHFGASLKDEPQDRSSWDAWLGKFESLLRRMYWWSATACLRTEFEPERIFRWLPSAASIRAMTGEPPRCIQEWDVSVTELPNGSS